MLKRQLLDLGRYSLDPAEGVDETITSLHRCVDMHRISRCVQNVWENLKNTKTHPNSPKSHHLRASVCGTGMQYIVPFSCGIVTDFRACESLSDSDSLFSSLRFLVKSPTNQSFHGFTMPKLWFVSFISFFHNHEPGLHFWSQKLTRCNKMVQSGIRPGITFFHCF